MNPFRKAVRDYLAMRRSLGFKLEGVDVSLGQFASFLHDHGSPTITMKLALQWAQQPQQVQPAQWAKRLSYVRGFARYWSAIDSRTEIPPWGLLPYRPPRARPYIYTDKEIRQLVEAAQRLLPATGLRRWTYPTLFGLLAATGLRHGEIRKLNRDDVNLKKGVLVIRGAKFGKSRLVPLHISVCRQLKQYALKRDQFHPHRSIPTFFVSDQGTPLSKWAIRWTFIQLSRQIGLRGPSDRVGPRIHDLRHRFAVSTLLRWYRAGVNVEQRLPLLSTYLGHTKVTDTYWYLSAVPELLALTKNRLEKRWEALS